MPPASPATEATTATTRVSTSPATSTCPRVAPTARSSADSRVRWATRIEKVLAMLTAPTNRAMPANTRRKLRTMSRKVALISSTFSAASCAPVRASSPSGTAARTRSTRSAPSSPSSARTSTLLTRSGATPRYLRASSRVKPT